MRCFACECVSVRMFRLRFCFAAACLLVATGGQPALAQSPPPTAAAPTDWPDHGANPYETNFGPEAQISPATIGRLGLAWQVDLPGEAGLEATPIEVGGTVFFTGSYGAVYAVNARTGRLLWKYDPEIWNFNPAKMRDLFAVNRGPTYDNGRIFSAALDGRLFALDAKDGRLLWVVETVPKDSPQVVSGAPRTFRGKVIIGQAGADFGMRGYVTAYDQATGKQSWRFYTAPGSPQQNKGDPAQERAAATWHGEYWKTGTGGAVWDGITFDPDLNRIYIGTGNAGPSDAEKRSPGGGDNLYTASIVALDADTGTYLWHYQVVPRDAWDFDCAMQMTLADLTIGGTPHKVLMQAPKDGFLYVLDRQTGKLLSAGKIVKVTWAKYVDLKTGRPVEAPNMRYQHGVTILFPSASGAHTWQAQSFSPLSKLIYVPVKHDGMTIRKGAAKAGEVENAGVAAALIPPAPGTPIASLLAWDPVTQKKAWEVPQDTIWNGGVLSTAGGLVFEGTGDGYFSAWDATTGKLLWRFYAGLGINGAPISFSLDGTQYISVLVGYGGGAGAGGSAMLTGWSFVAPRRLLTFALDGKEVLGPTPPRFAKVTLLDNPALHLDPTAVASGEQLFAGCALCHGVGAVSAGPAPDLRASPIALDPSGLWAVVHDGTLLQQGMPRFETLTRAQVNDIFQYIREQSRRAPSSQ